MRFPQPLLASAAACLFFSALPVAAQQAAPAPATANHAKWESEIATFERADRENPPPKGAVLFIGSSSIRMWTTLAQDFPEHAVINRGFGGSEIADSVYFAERIVLPCEPRLIVFYAGGNDLNAGKSPQEVAADFKAFVAKVQAKLPQTEIAYISIAGNPARWAQVEKVKATNAMIEEFTKTTPRLKFINVFPHMLGSDGLPRPEIFLSDRLHMNAAGYELWTKIVRPFLGVR
jgi:lysophospholipase L1-like esterase